MAKRKDKPTLETAIQRANEKRKAIGMSELDLLLDSAKEEPLNCGSLGRISMAFHRGTLKVAKR